MFLRSFPTSWLATTVLLTGLLASRTAAALPPLQDVIAPAKPLVASEEMADQLYPVGFSPRGAFAFLEISADEAVGCTLWGFTIVDLVTDRVVFRDDWHAHGQVDCKEQLDLEQVWARHSARFRVALLEHGVQPTHPGRLTRFPLERGGEVFTVQLERGLPRKNDIDGKDVPIDVIMTSSVRGSKRIGGLVERDMAGMPMTYGHTVMGFIPSPHEPRVVVVIREERRGWEGPPDVLTYTVMGASLAKGFR